MQAIFLPFVSTHQPGAVPIGLSGAQLVAVVRSAIAGDLHDSPFVRRLEPGLPLGREAGLSARESSVLRLVVQGYSNQEIASRLFLSINSIKTYIRTTYRKLGVSNRQQAVTWGIQHGFPIEGDEVRASPEEPAAEASPAGGN